VLRNYEYLFVFPGGNIGSKEKPVEILERAFSLQTGMVVLSSILISVKQYAGIDGVISFSNLFWLVTDCCKDTTREGEPELPQGVSLVWMEASDLWDLIFESHRPALLVAIKKLARLDKEFAWVLSGSCPGLFPAK